MMPIILQLLCHGRLVVLLPLLVVLSPCVTVLAFSTTSVPWRLSAKNRIACYGTLTPTIEPTAAIHQMRPHMSAAAVFTDDSSPVQDSFGQDEQNNPLWTNVLLRNGVKHLGGGSIMAAAMAGLRVWKRVLVKGRLPIHADFSSSQLEQDVKVWPTPELLFTALVNTMTDLQLPRFVLRHPETVSAVLLSMLQLIVDFNEQRVMMQKQQQQLSVDETIQEENNDSLILLHDNKDDAVDILDDGVVEDDVQFLSSEQLDALAQDVASGLVEQWGGVIGGAHALDQLFGSGHGLLDLQEGGSDDGFGLQDGVWGHSGWRMIPDLQRQLASMPELRHLMKSLGRRPTAQNSDAVHKFAPRELNPDGGLGAQFDPTLRDSVNGLTLSSSLSEMLPSEAVLLRAASPALRRLFLAKKVESKLLSYQFSGWQDAPSIPRTRPRYLPRMPSAPGGPIVVCLDTSWSMSGMRERLSKAVVLACVSAAHKQHRDCHVVAFSTEHGVMEAGEITADAKGVRRLLEFLSHSFGGGTDVTGALKHAMEVLGTEQMAAADVLLVTDGEIPDPPLSIDVMEDLGRLKQRTGMQVHGLLVGKKESKPLAKLCTQTHNFLFGYDTLAATALSSSTVDLGTASSLASSRFGHATGNMRHDTLDSRTSSALSALPCRKQTFRSSASCADAAEGWQRKGAGRRTALRQKYGWSSGRDSRAETERIGASIELYAKRKRSGRRNRWDEDDEFWEDNWSRGDETEVDYNDDNGGSEGAPAAGSFNAKVEEATSSLQVAVAEILQEQVWKAADLDSEKNAEGSCWRYRSELKAAVDRISEGLVEREEESRLVVLGMVANEHVLFLGPPGTGKSVLGRRLSKLCGGNFFQRLLTRFTTPEEIFGPLSLRALENDEYRRCTAGFLPTASVAFLDEIFKANSAILNTLLTILNERQYDNGAGVREECPIRCVVGASNELPESDELDALYDRFLLRKEVMPVSDDGIVRILGMSSPGVSVCDVVDGPSSECDVVFSDGLDRVIIELSKAADAVHMGDDACALIRDLRTYMREELNVDVSDRRLVKAARLLKVSAACHGRTRVDPLDCLLLQHVVWRLPEQRGTVREWLWDHLTPGGAMAEEPPSAAIAQFRLLLNGIRREALVGVRKTAGDVSGAAGARDADVTIIKSLRTEASRIVMLLQQRSATLARHMELLRRSMDHLWLDPDEARAAQQLLLPRAEAISMEVDRALADCRALELALSEDPASPPNDLRLSVIEMLWDEEDALEATFTTEELSIGMKEAKAKYDADAFRMWKRARKKANKQTT